MTGRPALDAPGAGGAASTHPPTPFARGSLGRQPVTSPTRFGRTMNSTPNDPITAGETPGGDAEEALRARLRAELTRRETAVATIRQQLHEQPSVNAVRACARRWCVLINQIAEDIAERQG